MTTPPTPDPGPPLTEEVGILVGGWIRRWRDTNTPIVLTVAQQLALEKAVLVMVTKERATAAALREELATTAADVVAFREFLTLNPTSMAAQLRDLRAENDRLRAEVGRLGDEVRIRKLATAELTADRDRLAAENATLRARVGAGE